MANVFIAYSFKDSGFADSLAAVLRDAGHEVHYFDRVLPAREYRAQFEYYMTNTDVFIPIISKKSLNNPNVWGEIGAALGYYSHRQTPFIFPLLLDDTKIPPDLERFAAMDVNRSGIDDWKSQFIAVLERSLASIQAVKQDKKKASMLATTARALARATLDIHPSIFDFSFSLSDIFSKKRREQRKTLEERKTELVKELTDSGIDPVMFDILLSNEMDRIMKLRFGIVFLILTVLFTLISYLIVVLDSTFKWGISEVAITTLIIEIPIQFVGLLYIIARNLFPSIEKTGIANDNGQN